MNQETRKKHKSSKKHAEVSPAIGLILTYAKPVLISLGTAAVLLILSALIASSLPDPDVAISPLSYAALYLSTFIGGIFAAKNSFAPFVMTMIHSGILLVIYALASVFNYSPTDIRLGILPSLLLHALIPLTSIAGGFIETKTAEKKHKRHKH